MFGYFLTADTSLQKMFMLIGPPRSGKGTILRVLTDLLGNDNVCGSSFGSLASDFGLEPMRDKLAAIFPDVRLGKKTDGGAITEKLLSISGEDTVVINEKYKPMSHGRISARILIVSNEIPNLVDASSALTNRFIFLETRKSFLGKEDTKLSETLSKELPQIFLWALEGRERLQKRGSFVQPNVSKHMSEDMYRMNNPVGAFIDECCLLGDEHFVSKTDLYDAYRVWCQETGYNFPKGMSSFSRDLISSNYRIRPSKKMEEGHRYPCFNGVALNASSSHLDYEDLEEDDDA